MSWYGAKDCIADDGEFVNDGSTDTLADDLLVDDKS